MTCTIVYVLRDIDNRLLLTNKQTTTDITKAMRSFPTGPIPRPLEAAVTGSNHQGQGKQLPPSPPPPKELCTAKPYRNSAASANLPM